LSIENVLRLIRITMVSQMQITSVINNTSYTKLSTGFIKAYRKEMSTIFHAIYL